MGYVHCCEFLALFGESLYNAEDVDADLGDVG